MPIRAAHCGDSIGDHNVATAGGSIYSKVTLSDRNHEQGRSEERLGANQKSKQAAGKVEDQESVVIDGSEGSVRTKLGKEVGLEKRSRMIDVFESATGLDFDGDQLVAGVDTRMHTRTQTCQHTRIGTPYQHVCATLQPSSNVSTAWSSAPTPPLCDPDFKPSSFPADSPALSDGEGASGSLNG